MFLRSQEFSSDSEFGLIQENACFLAFTVQLINGRMFFHLTPLKKNYLQVLFDKCAITNP